MIAIAGPNLPLDLVAATGRDAGPLAFDPNRPAPRARQWLESKFAPWAPPVLEAWAQGAYDGIDQVLFSRADDTSQRLYYYLCELQRRGAIAGPEPLICDIAKIARPTSLARTVAKLRDLAERLGVADQALETAIVAANRQRGAAPVMACGKACLLAGTAPADRRLHEAVAAAGFVPVGRTLAEDWADLGPLIEEGTGDPLSALGRQMHLREGGSRSFADPAALLGRAVAQAKAAAVVLWRIEEDEAQTWHLPAERRLLEASGVPHLVLTRRDWLARDGAAGEITTFLQGVER
jgi:hypothetical protein